MVDNIVRLFEDTATSFQSNGLGSLPDASLCEVVEERNSTYELEMEYHVSGKRYSEIQLRRILVAKPNPYTDPQPFRIYEISKPINGLVTVKAEHISYDMSGYPVAPFSAENAADAVAGLAENSIVDCPFTFSTDLDITKDFTFTKPASMRSLFGSDESDSILSIYGGECEFDGYNIILHKERGKDRGVTIRYGKNLTDLTQEENCSEVYTAVYPFWYSDDWGLIELPEKTISTGGTYNYTRIYPLDLSSDWENTYEWDDEYPSEDEIRELANQYISENELGIPTVSLTVSFEQLSQNSDYAHLAALDRVQLCDIVTVEFPDLNVSTIAECVKTTYNVLTGKYESLELGEVQSDLASSIASTNSSVDSAISSLSDAVDEVSNSALTIGEVTDVMPIYTYTNGKSIKVTSSEATVVQINPSVESVCKALFIATIPFEMSLDGYVTFRYYINSTLQESDTVTQYCPRGDNIVTISNNMMFSSTGNYFVNVTMETGYFESDARMQAAQIAALKDYIDGGSYAEEVDTTEPYATIEAMAVKSAIYAPGLGSTDLWDGTLTASDTISLSDITLGVPSGITDLPTLSEEVSATIDNPNVGAFTETVSMSDIVLGVPSGITILPTLSEKVSVGMTVTNYEMTTSKAISYDYDSTYVTTDNGAYALITSFSASSEAAEIDEGNMAKLHIDLSVFSEVESVVISG